MKLTWYGHSAFRIEVGAAKILIDPFLSDNPSWKKGWEKPAEGVTHVLLVQRRITGMVEDLWSTPAPASHRRRGTR